ncbi:uncharacterized protein EI90DRAFT_3118835 [Cantharellus anzutake]|uniref:uncharacterized protein n=1 Tax=Cantharellus anzutake TaxID=1750568 RepID=UPI0019082464|nr:uncharacterized protein EI90DRAFT_3118835 [Cantharellus anzutake]KAF8337398.1 hypothetical protein EI90DRAFT_3118835 [Cantharellus anzutake]
MYWLDGRDLDSNGILLRDLAQYWDKPRRREVENKTISEIDVLASGLKSAVAADDHQRWLISASEYVDAIIWFARRQALWSYEDKGVGFGSCHETFEWLDSVHAKWVATPMPRLYALARERYIKSLPTESLGPSTLSMSQQPLSPCPLGFFTKPTSNVASTSNPGHVNLETPSAHQHPVDCAASNDDSSRTAACADAVASPAATQHPHQPPPPPKSMHPSSTPSNVSAPASTDAPLSSSASTPSSDVSATSKRRRRRGRKKRRSERHSAPITPVPSISSSVHSPIPFPPLILNGNHQKILHFRFLHMLLLLVAKQCSHVFHSQFSPPPIHILKGHLRMSVDTELRIRLSLSPPPSRFSNTQCLF